MTNLEITFIIVGSIFCFIAGIAIGVVITNARYTGKYNDNDVYRHSDGTKPQQHRGRNK